MCYVCFTKNKKHLTLKFDDILFPQLKKFIAFFSPKRVFVSSLDYVELFGDLY